MLTRLGINAVAAALIIPLWTVGTLLLSDAEPHSGVVIPPESLLLSVILFGAWSLIDFVRWLKERRSG